MKGPPRTAAGGARLGEPRLRWLREVWGSTIGKKVIVAITGMIMVGYVVLHAAGNLKALQGNGGEGEAAIDKYAEWLRTFGEPAIPEEGVLWTVRVILIAALILHVVGVTQLWARNRGARPAGHRRAKVLGRSISSRTMIITGSILLAFIVFHVLHFTTGTIDTTPIETGEVYANLYGAFQKWYFVAIYLGAAILLGFHLWHALWSVSQTAGFDKPNRNRTIRRAGTATALGVTIFFISIPIAFWTELLDPPTEQDQVNLSRNE